MEWAAWPGRLCSIDRLTGRKPSLLSIRTYLVLYALLVVLALLLLVMIISYNKLVGLRQLVRNAWSDVDIYLKRRAELIPNLVSTVKGYATHEQSTIERVVAARNVALGERTVTGRADAEAKVSSGIASVVAVAENYPVLKASDNFLSLQSGLSETEKLIASARQYYNACVRDYNTAREAFPSVIAAGLFNFKPADFFELEALSERDAPTVAMD